MRTILDRSPYDGQSPNTRSLNRRRFLCDLGAAAGAAAIAAPRLAALESASAVHDSDAPESTRPLSPHPSFATLRSPTYSVIPVVGDGKWIWTEPPKTGSGYLEPRSYEARLGIELQGQGKATDIRATTPVPIPLPEQKFEREDVDIDTRGCQAAIRKLDEFAAELSLAAPAIAAGETIRAAVTFRLTLYKQYDAFHREQFYREGEPPRDVRKAYLQNSPGIETSADEVGKLARDLVAGVVNPWDRAKRFHDWVWNNIRARPGKYTNVTTALKTRVGDCEERAAVFVALCRAIGVPARLVWVPNHNWAEFYLTDADGNGHWIPAHTSCYAWFGWTGAHELVLQKGDRIRVPHRHTTLRLQEDWAQWSGRRPTIRWFAELKPLAAKEGEDAGPGARKKDEKGEWLVTGEHTLDAKLRDGERLVARK